MPTAGEEFDIGPLSWVKPEIELALRRADEGIRRFSVNPGDQEIARSTLAHLHQVSGALLMVGLEPIARVSEAVEKLIELLGHGDIASGPEITGAIRGAIAALSHYLEGLMRGDPNRPLLLFPVYKGVLAAGDNHNASEVDLFYPDLSHRPKFSDSASRRVNGAELAALLAIKRTEFQRGLLNIIRGKDLPQNLQGMRNALATIEATQTAGTRVLWWIAVGFIDGLIGESKPLGIAQKQLCGRIDLQIKRQAEGADTVSERLIRELLFAIALMPSSGRVHEIQETYRLHDLLPPKHSENPEDTRVRHALRELKEQLEQVKETWIKFTGGHRGSLPQFVEETTRLKLLAQGFSNEALHAVFAKLGDVASDLNANPREPSEALALETATTLLMAKDAVDNYWRLGSNFKSLAETAVVRVAAALKGQSLPSEGGSQLADISRTAQEKMLFFQLGQEILTNLNHIEQGLDAFFRDPAKRSDLAAIPTSINQVLGALSMLESEDAVNVLKASRSLVEKFISSDGPANLEDAELTAEAFSNLGLFVAALQQGRERPDEVLHGVLARFNIAPSRPVPQPEPEPEEAPPLATEEDLQIQKRAIAQLFERWQHEPGLTSRTELTHALSALRQDAQLAGQDELAAQAIRAINIVADASSQSASTVRDAFVAMLGANLLPEPQPSKPVGVVEPEAAEIDAELLEVFLEEANEVLGGIALHRDVLFNNASDREAFAVVRRGFHTLKGSGRMVGLTDLGEVAWQVEQVMNKCLREEKPVSKGLQRLISEAHQSFEGWISTLQAGGKPNVEAAGIFRLADQLKNDQEPEDEDDIPLPEATVAETFVAPADDGIAMVDETPAVPEIIIVKPVQPAAEIEPSPKVIIGNVVVDPDFFGIFANEATTHVNTLRRELAAVCGDPPQVVSHDFMRAAHTLTGICRICGFTEIAELGFALEKWLLERLENPTPFTQDHLALTVEACEALENMVASVLDRQPPEAAPALVERLESHLGYVRSERRDQESKHALEEIEALDLAVSGSHFDMDVLEEAGEDVFLRPSEFEAMRLDEAEEIEPAADELLSFHEGLTIEPAIPEPQATTQALPTPVEILPTESTVTAPFTTAQTIAPQKNIAAPPSEERRHQTESNKDRRLVVDDVDEQLLPVFLEEAYEIIPGVGDAVRSWRTAPGNKAPAQLLGRHLHTLKGSARMAGAMRVGELAHLLENRVVAMQAEALPTLADFDALEDGFDRFATALEHLKNGQPIELEPAAESVASSVSDASVNIPGAIGVMHDKLSAPTPQAAAATAQGEEADRRPVLRVRSELVDRFVNDAGEISIARSRIEGEMNSFRQGLAELIENVTKLRAQLREIEIQSESQIQSTIQHQQQEVGDTFDPLEFDRFTRMQELTRFMAESVHDFVTLQQSLTKNLDEVDAALASQSRLNRDLQQELMAVRMVPLGNLTDRLYRVVRQTAKELGKKANLEFKGTRTELDRSVLEQIIAPFEHLLRNAIAHGIESPEVREAAGKPPIGEITIDARQQANEIVLTFSDDGGGINAERVRQKAVEQGLLPADEHPTESQLIEYIFMPGFSTATEISQVAGRGVGMDVVKNAIVNLGGNIEVHTILGQGTKFVITLPLTLAVTQVLLIRANGTLFGVPSAMVEQVQEWKIAEITALREKKEVVWQNNIYPFHLLSNLLGEEERTGEPRRYFPILLLRSGVHRVAVEIDSIEGNREIVVKSIGPQLARLTGVAGATVLGNGQVVLMLNPVSLASRQEGPLLVHTETKAEVAKKAPLVMVVDDSLTVRKITSRLLLREGYQVVTAKDGVDAIQQLQEFIPDVMLLDVEMPRMDGFELTRNVRGDSRTAHIPIIMITSRTAEKHRNYALQLGVNEYMGKPFQEDELLTHVGRFTGREVSVEN
ncbi:MAG: Hpt domain-containing protein [Pseudomonadota bacterium]